MWGIKDIAFEMLSDMTDDPVVTLLVSTPYGPLVFITEPVEQGSTLVLQRTHVQGAKAGAIGMANLGMIAQTLLEGMGYDELVVEGALRTSGANPGHRPRRIRYARRLRPSVASDI